MKHKQSIFLCIFLLGCGNVIAQDKEALLKEFNTVMKFTVQPYLYYSTVVKMNAEPILQPEDTMHLTGEFYKNENDLYYRNDNEIMYIEDSFFIQIHHERKSIWIGKIDVNSKERMNILPMHDKKMQELFSKKYTINKMAINANSNRLEFENIETETSQGRGNVKIGLQYTAKELLPEIMELNVSMKQSITPEMQDELKKSMPDLNKLLVVEEGETFIVRKQYVEVSFSNITNNKEKAGQMPTWKSILNYDTETNEFSSKGLYADYEITKTF